MKYRLICLAAAAVMSVSAMGCAKSTNNADTAKTKEEQTEEAGGTEASDDSASEDEKLSEEDGDAGENAVEGFNEEDEVYEEQDALAVSKPSKGTVFKSDIIVTAPGSEEDEADVSEGGSTYEEQYILEYTDGDKGVFTDKYSYSYGMTSTTSYDVSITEKDGKLRLFYGNDNDGIDLTMDGDKIVNVYYFYGDSSASLEKGTYTEKDDVYGDLVLEVGDEGKAVLTDGNGKSMEGYISSYQDDYEFTYYPDSENEDSIDWIIYVSDHDFTHETYRAVVYGQYEGSYDMVGDLGELTMTVDGEGYASLTAKVNGVNRSFKGSVDYDYVTGELNGAYLLSDDGYDLSLNIVKLEDGTINYSGNLSMPLNAG